MAGQRPKNVMNVIVVTNVVNVIIVTNVHNVYNVCNDFDVFSFLLQNYILFLK